ncbi:Heterokaryon incompatibility protein 6, OR allele [Pseudocercospora fuligena]|uniref:Heterokaryon incompatibility protein 6, OR allele n=1 Tax=Pseudocercospora fuligena TaxID=685502 RepID=A0A8H6RW35_9PEZI|nr:Heterokaryon incompatibility protein 6, OR allele [Pseudocercospora fuligena]
MNLDEALRNVRNGYTKRVLWVDAVCINQLDLAEKELQIPLMRDIYVQAKHSLIWLGERGHPKDLYSEWIGMRMLYYPYKYMVILPMLFLR